MVYKTIKEATEQWVRGFNAYPNRMIELIMESDDNDLMEITKPSVGITVYVYSRDEHAEITEYDAESDTYTVRFLDNDETVSGVYDSDFECEREYGLPMWGTMWQFDSSWDNDWLEENISIMSELGFRIYESQEFGYFFGIDGAGYDFYNAHWIPLYKARGLHWHEEDA